ncbi:MAG: Gfo/Idh/MocA family oxidoreductase [Spirochaetaceae bacterium]|jgi:predicted dehydrogenase|nr:Gfo/Idh/MocA family oxidoreductase [Spirochaetaceae bacterium]
MKRRINWALVGTGGITNSFLTGLRAAEGANPLAIVSRSKESADRFAAKYGIEKTYAGADAYDRMLRDPDIEVIYIGTPHVFHRDLAIRAFRAKKGVLCEKPVSINAGELAGMISCARENGVFFMEAMWTRFVPSLRKVREWLAQGLIGEVKMVEANFGFNIPWNPEGRLLNRELGGGALLDAGVYPISLASMVFGGGKPEKIASLLYLGQTGVDEEFSGLISYGGCRIATVSAALRTAMVNDGWIYGSSGRIHLPDFVFSHKARLICDGRYSYDYEGEFLSNGYNYEAEAVMDCIREGKTECDVMSLEESQRIMEIMDEIRSQWHFRYPSEG